MTEPQPLPPEDYDAVEHAVQSTERGRWFLQEFARRIHAEDARAVLAALGSLEGHVFDRRRQPPPGAARLVEQAIERAQACRRDFSGEAGRRIAEIERISRAALDLLTTAPDRGAEPSTAAQIAAAVARAIGVDSPSADRPLLPANAATAVAAPAPVASSPPRPRLPRASSPDLLEGMNDAEKAMLLS